MKPVKLTIEGINSFTDAQTLDFETAGRTNLFCICGKTGAGKTTVFDSIMLALYGKSAKGNLADIVNLSLMKAAVTLEFSEAGELYTVERTVKCRYEKDSTGKPTDKRLATAECLLYKNGAPIAKGDAANEVIAGIIGLEAAEFKNVYMLEQGEYAEFLKKSPAKQTEAVGKIFSLMRFGDVYKLSGEKAKREREECENIKKRMETFGDVSGETLKELKDSLRSLRAKTTSLVKDVETRKIEIASLEKERDGFIAAQEKMKAVRELMLQVDEAQKREFEVKTQEAEFEKTVDPKESERLAELREKLNKLSELGALDRQYLSTVEDGRKKSVLCESAGKETEIAREKFSRLKEDVVALADEKSEKAAAAAEIARSSENRSAVLEAVLKAAAEELSVGEISDLIYSVTTEKAEFDRLIVRKAETEKRLSDKVEKCANMLEKIERYNVECTAVKERVTDLEHCEKAAAEAYAAAQIESHAEAVRAELKAGDRCPVCGGEYHGGVSCGDTDVDAKKRELETVTAALKTEKARRDECEKHCDLAKAEYARAVTDKEGVEKELKTLDEDITATKVDPEKYVLLESALRALKTAAERKNRAEDELLRCQPEISSAEAKLAAAEQAVKDSASKAEALKAALGEHCGKTESEIAQVKGLTAELEKKLAETDKRRREIAATVASAAAATEAVRLALEKAKAECPVDMPQFDEQAYSEKREAIDRINKQINENEIEIAGKENEAKHMAEAVDNLTALKAEAENRTKRAKIYDTIGEMTRSKAMLNYVAAEYIADFTGVASEILGDLSSGKYTMSYDRVNGFVVYDYLNSGKARKTETLSGGELFLASLSVAIAIARTQSNGNNAFFFLDEGFGTLDEELIDVVYSSLEALSRDCLVGVITHAEALIARMPSCVKIAEATDTCGSRIEI